MLEVCFSQCYKKR